MKHPDEKFVFVPTKLNTAARNQIADKVTAFLQQGGEIQQIPNGISAPQTLDARRQITIQHRQVQRKKKNKK